MAEPVAWFKIISRSLAVVMNFSNGLIRGWRSTDRTEGHMSPSCSMISTSTMTRIPRTFKACGAPFWPKRFRSITIQLLHQLKAKQPQGGKGRYKGHQMHKLSRRRGAAPRRGPWSRPRQRTNRQSVAARWSLLTRCKSEPGAGLALPVAHTEILNRRARRVLGQSQSRRWLPQLEALTQPASK